MTSSMPERTSSPQVYLHPGQIFATTAPTLVTTILGSCVTVCLRDPVTGVTGINHFLLPRNPMRGTDDARYGDTAMESLAAAMWKEGALGHRTVAKIFGGACVLRGYAPAGRSIGEQNVEIARRFLESHHIEVVAAQTGGVRGRKLVFDTADGAAWLKEI